VLFLKQIYLLVIFIINISLPVISSHLIINNNSVIITQSKSLYKFPQYKQILILEKFIKDKMTHENGGIYTNYLDNDNEKNYSTGHEVLSESVGLEMLIALKNNDSLSFDELIKLLEDKFQLSNGLFRWRIGVEKITYVSATIDDLRIYKALNMAYEQWDKIKYKTMAKQLGYNLKNNAMKNDHFINYVNSTERNSNSDILDINYIDLKALTYMKDQYILSDKYINSSLTLISTSQLNEGIPLYFKTYNITNNSFAELDNINMIDSILVAYHLAEVGKLGKKEINWFHKQFDEFGYISTKYNKNGNPISEDQSTAIYSMIAQLSKYVEDDKLYYEAIDKLLQFQVVDKNSEIYGSFGDTNKLQVYSYDNLHAWLALK
jgi:hypothetical protein